MAFAWREEFEQFADLAPGWLDIAGLGAAQEMFELGEHLLGLRSGLIGRQEDEMCAFGAHFGDGERRFHSMVSARFV